MDVIQNQPDTITVVISDASDGSPFTGVVDTDITMYIRKDGGSPVAKTIDNTNFREVDATNMPGLYEIDFTAADFDTLGEFVAVIQATAAFDQVSISLKVVKDVITQLGGAGFDSQRDTLQNLRTLQDLAHDKWESSVAQVVKNTTPSFAVQFINDKGEAVTGIAEESHFNSSFIQGGTVSSESLGNWTEVDALNLPGFYRFTLPSALTGTTGELALQMAPGDVNWTSAGVDMSQLDVYPDLYDIETIDDGTNKYALIVGTQGQDFAEDGEIYFSTDFLNWTRDTPAALSNYGFYPDTWGCDVKMVGGDVVRTFVGEAGHFFVDIGDGNGWVDVSNTNVTTTLRSVAIKDKTHIVACGDGGALLRFDGSATAVELTSGTVESLRDITYDAGAGAHFAVGTNGILLRVTSTGSVFDQSSHINSTSNLLSIFANASYRAIGTADDGVWISQYFANFTKMDLPEVTDENGDAFDGNTEVSWDHISVDGYSNETYQPFVILNEMGGISIRQKGSGDSSNNDWVQDTFEGAGTSRRFWAIARHGLMPGIFDGTIEIFEYTPTPQFYNRVLRFQIVEPSSGGGGGGINWQ